MKTNQAVEYCLQYHKTHSCPNTVRSYKFVLFRLAEKFGDREIDSFTPDEIFSFLNSVTEGTVQTTKRGRYMLVKAFFNFIKSTIDPKLENHCDAPITKKMFGRQKPTEWSIFEKDTIDEVIYRTSYTRNRLLLELMARAGMRVGEVLKLTPDDVGDRKILLRSPKSGRSQEVVYITQKLGARLKGYIKEKGLGPSQRIFPITYGAAWLIVKNAGQLVNINLRPHDLRRHAATYASRCGTPIEIVSKIILRHSSLAITQCYLGKVTDHEAMRWIESLHG